MPKGTGEDAAIDKLEQESRREREERRAYLAHDAELDQRIAEAMQRSRRDVSRFVPNS
jgi:hypothetical protein